MEHYIRPLIKKRKNSLFFGNDEMKHTNTTYYIYSILEYQKKSFAEITSDK